MVSNVQQHPTREEIEDPDWVYSILFKEEKLKELKKSGILNFTCQWLNMISIFIFILTNEEFALGDMSALSTIYFALVLFMANWTGSLAATKFWFYSQVRRSQRRYVVRHGLLPWWQQKEFGGWK